MKVKNSAELEQVKREYEAVKKLKLDAMNIYSLGRARKQGPAIKKAYNDMKAAIDRLWGIVEMRGLRLEAEK